jgi:hypothetical protein
LRRDVDDPVDDGDSVRCDVHQAGPAFNQLHAGEGREGFRQHRARFGENALFGFRVEDADSLERCGLVQGPVSCGAEFLPRADADAQADFITAVDQAGKEVMQQAEMVGGDLRRIGVAACD